MRTILPTLAIAAGIVAFPAPAAAQQQPLERLPPERLDARSPSALVAGEPGAMSVRSTTCRTLPTGDTRRRIVDIAAQEWGFFGFSIVDYTADAPRGAPRYRWWRRRVDPREGARTASTIAGYWAATPRGTWMIDRQNGRWNGSDGLAARWRDPWSAAFVSWVMCEGGLGTADQFQRSIAHHAYVDQAIRARDAGSSPAAFTAHDVGATEVEPGDLLCSSRRRSYTSIAQRRRHLGVGARMHCDIVVKVEPGRERILAIGGNVRGTVSLKLLPAVSRGGRLVPTRSLFAHLKLQADPIEDHALDASPTLEAVRSTDGMEPPAPLAAPPAPNPGTNPLRH
jgi:hypothetical protein